MWHVRFILISLGTIASHWGCLEYRHVISLVSEHTALDYQTIILWIVCLEEMECERQLAYLGMRQMAHFYCSGTLRLTRKLMQFQLFTIYLCQIKSWHFRFSLHICQEGVGVGRKLHPLLYQTGYCGTGW